MSPPPWQEHLREVSKALLRLLRARDRFLLRAGAVLHDEIRWMRSELLRNSLQSCGPDCSFNFPLRIEGADRVSLGARVSIAPYVHIWGQGGVEIGDDCLIGSHVAITSITHNKQRSRYNEENVAARVKIGSNVWIGAHAVILPGLEVGDGAIIGAAAVVTHSVPPQAVVAGVPARPLQRP